jgi:hypothetical protein
MVFFMHLLVGNDHPSLLEGKTHPIGEKKPNAFGQWVTLYLNLKPRSAAEAARSYGDGSF